MTTVITEDRIEKEILLKAPLSRVWQALSNAGEFGDWFGVKLEAKTFAAGERMQGQFTIPGYEHKTLDLLVDRVEPENYFSYRWHPCSSKENIDRSNEATTLVEFMLSEKEGQTLLRVVESGFDALPAERRGDAFCNNSRGWEGQLRNIAKYVGGSADTN